MIFLNYIRRGFRNLVLSWHRLYEIESPIESGPDFAMEYVPEDFEWYEERYMD